MVALLRARARHLHRNYKPQGSVDEFCFNWLGIPANQASRIVALGVAAGAAMETFMVKVWIGKTNFYETVKKKEAERIRDVKLQGGSDEPRFADVLKQQWEERKKEMAEKANG